MGNQGSSQLQIYQKDIKDLQRILERQQRKLEREQRSLANATERRNHFNRIVTNLQHSVKMYKNYVQSLETAIQKSIERRDAEIRDLRSGMQQQKMYMS